MTEPRTDYPPVATSPAERCGDHGEAQARGADEMKPHPGQILHQVKEADWGCVRVEATGQDWAVCRTHLGAPILVRAGDQFAEAHEWVHEECPFTEVEVQW